MAFDGLIIKAITNELEHTLINGKIDKIHQPDKHTVILGFYNNGKNYILNLSTSPENSRLHITYHSKPNPSVALNFCMLLRKHLLGAKLLSINTSDLERVVEFEFECYGNRDTFYEDSAKLVTEERQGENSRNNEYGHKVTKKLIIEIMGRYSNIILVGKDYTVLDSLKHFSSSRNLSPGKLYVYPKSGKVSVYEVSSFEEFSRVLQSYDKGIEHVFTGFSKSFVTNISKNLENNLENIYEYIVSILNALNSPNLPLNLSCKLVNEGKDYIIEVGCSGPISEKLNINTFIDEFYFSKEEKELYINTKNSLLKIILSSLQKYSRRLENINFKIKSTNEMDKYKLFGELIIANLYKLTSNLDSITLENYYDNNNPVTIPLDKSISPRKNADKYFKKYSKLKNTINVVEKQKYETEKELDYLETIIYAIENSTNLEELQEVYDEMAENSLFNNKFKKNDLKKNNLKKNKKVEIAEIVVDGFKVLVGKNNKQNDYITTKLSKPNDIWFHTQKIHGSHVVLKTENKKVENSTLEKCAKFAAKYSRAKNSSNIPVDYTLAKYVKKPSGSKAGYVIYTNQKTLYINP